ncbi:MAG TPA: hypothetical protein VKY40_08035, partial [Halanaerobiales bacterium]|nr:hypothetical protein [Halanaerobiales bacterium]
MKKGKTILFLTFLVLFLLTGSVFICSAEKPYEVKIAFPTLGGNTQDVERVEEALSEITMEKINVTVSLLPLRIGNFNQQINLMLSGNEKLDLMSMMATVSMYQSQGHLLPLDDLLNEYGQDIKEIIGPELLEATTFDGKTYAVVPNRGYASGVGLLIRKDLLDKYNVDPAELQKKTDNIDDIVE